MKPSAQFLPDLEESRRSVSRFAQQIRDSGIYAEESAHVTRPHESMRMKYADDGDLMVCGRVEHKVRKLQFTSKEDYPYQTIFVDEKYKVDRKTDAPLAYVIENAKGTCAAVIYGWTRPHWKVERRWDEHQGRYCDFYTVHKDHARFCRPEEAFYVNPA